MASFDQDFEMWQSLPPNERGLDLPRRLRNRPIYMVGDDIGELEADVAKKEGFVSPFPKGSPFNPEPRNGKQGIYRSVAVKMPGNSSLMIVHVKEY